MGERAAACSARERRWTPSSRPTTETSRLWLRAGSFRKAAVGGLCCPFAVDAGGLARRRRTYKSVLSFPLSFSTKVLLGHSLACPVASINVSFSSPSSLSLLRFFAVMCSASAHFAALPPFDAAAYPWSMPRFLPPFPRCELAREAWEEEGGGESSCSLLDLRFAS